MRGRGRGRGRGTGGNRGGRGGKRLYFIEINYILLYSHLDSISLQQTQR